MLRTFMVAAAALALAGAARADEAAVKKALQAKYPKLVVDNVAKTPVAGLYEIYASGQILYVDESASYLIVDGRLIDVATRTDLTSERMQRLSAIPFDQLPLELAFKKVKGNGKRRLAYFADPNCRYCKRFEQEINAVSDITVYMFLYPILTPDSVDKSKAVWCSPNRVKAWDDWMQKGVAPSAQASCDTPVDKILEYGRKMSITGTPTLVFADGLRVPGMIPGDQLRKLLDAAPAK